MSMIEDGRRIGDYYDHLVDQYHYDPRSCDASSAELLRVRYAALADMADLSGKSVLDVGCGFGDLGMFIREHHPGVRYTGIDLSSRMIQVGKNLYPDLNLRHQDVKDCSPAEPFDYVMAQGIFYLLGEEAETKAFRLIDKMFSLCRNAVSFCAISAWALQQSPGEYYLDPSRCLKHCSTLTRRIVLRHDYLPHDVTFYLYKEPS